MSSKKNLLKGRRAYLSGPMDFVASREQEKKYGWRNQIGDFLRNKGATVLDPWNKPGVVGLQEYGREDEKTLDIKKVWTFAETKEGARLRAECAKNFRQVQHIDLRMVDVCDFVVSYCPTNIYSVGTPHEIVVARQQHKPVLLVSPPVRFPALELLREQIQSNDAAMIFLDRLEKELPVKLNEKGIPSLWYMPLVGTESFFDGFGFKGEKHTPERPLIPFLEKLDNEIPKKWDRSTQSFVVNDDWLLLEEE
jgi:hypothetical protein